MRVLFIDASAPAILAAVRAAGNDVEQVAEGDPNFRDVIELSCYVLVIEWHTPPATIEMLQSVTKGEGERPTCIVCSSKVTAARVDAACAAGAEDFIRKPVLIGQLLGRLGRILKQREKVAA